MVIGKKLKTVAEHNAERQAEWERQNRDIPTGIACPVCETEMVEPATSSGLSTYAFGPTRKNVHCRQCNRWESVLA